MPTISSTTPEATGATTTPPRPLGAAVLAVSDEVEEYSRSIPGHEFDIVRTGRGFGPNTVLSTQGDGFLAVSATTRFPILGRTTLDDDQVTAACITAAPPGSRWCEIDLQPGTVVVYGPGSDHAAIDPAGLGYVFVATSQTLLQELAADLELAFKTLPRGHAHVLAPSGKRRDLSVAISAVVEAAAGGVDPAVNREDDVLHVLTSALSDDHRTRRIGGRSKTDNRQLVRTCIEYVKTIDRIASIRELCLVAHVSERRLRYAFSELYGLPPAQFFRVWAMNEARRRLRAGRPGQDTVAQVAVDLGFAHYGRFAGRYRALFGEAPSTTLAERF